MEFGMSRRIKPKEKYVRISMKEIWRNLDGLTFGSCNFNFNFGITVKFSYGLIALPSELWLVSSRI